MKIKLMIKLLYQKSLNKAIGYTIGGALVFVPLFLLNSLYRISDSIADFLYIQKDDSWWKKGLKILSSPIWLVTRALSYTVQATAIIIYTPFALLDKLVNKGANLLKFKKAHEGKLSLGNKVKNFFKGSAIAILSPIWLPIKIITVPLSNGFALSYNNRKFLNKRSEDNYNEVEGKSILGQVRKFNALSYNNRKFLNKRSEDNYNEVEGKSILGQFNALSYNNRKFLNKPSEDNYNEVEGKSILGQVRKFNMFLIQDTKETFKYPRLKSVFMPVISLLSHFHSSGNNRMFKEAKVNRQDTEVQDLYKILSSQERAVQSLRESNRSNDNSSYKLSLISNNDNYVRGSYQQFSQKIRDSNSSDLDSSLRSSVGSDVLNAFLKDYVMKDKLKKPGDRESINQSTKFQDKYKAKTALRSKTNKEVYNYSPPPN
jgi:hypothetical protein